MKNKFIFPALILLFSGIISYAQNTKDPYVSVLGENRIWYIANRQEFGDIETFTLHTGTTELVNDIEYTQITREIGGPIEALLREDTNERKVYKYEGGIDIIYYDFSLEVGESIFISAGAVGWFIVDAIEYINTEVGLRKAWFLSNSSSGVYTPVWIEGIGSLAGLLEPTQQPNLNWWDFPELLCFENEGVMEYKSDNGTTYGCQLESIGIEEPTNPLQVNLSPNPIKEKAIITFSNPTHSITELSIFDFLGKLIKQEETTNDHFIIEKKDYQTGIYIFQIKTNKNIYKSKFIIP